METLGLLDNGCFFSTADIYALEMGIEKSKTKGD